MSLATLRLKLQSPAARVPPFLAFDPIRAAHRRPLLRAIQPSIRFLSAVAAASPPPPHSFSTTAAHIPPSTASSRAATTAMTDSNTQAAKSVAASATSTAPGGPGKPDDTLKWASKDGEFRRQVSSFRDHVSCDPQAKYVAEKGRYHLYVSLACPWAHRVLIVRALKGLEDCLSVSVVHYLLGPEGWEFPQNDGDCPGATRDHLYGSHYLKELYLRAEPGYQGRFTVPVLWDKKTHTIVNNESSEIIRMLNTTFDAFATRPAMTFYPESLRPQIDGLNDWVYDSINNGVYKAGFATAQAPYDRAVTQLFDALDRVEHHLEAHAKDGPWLFGKALTEADVRLFTTIVRFDPVYHGHFKCNWKTIEFGYPHILRWAARFYALPGIKETCNLEHIKKHYYMSHVNINPTRVVPAGNGPDLLKYLN